MIELAVIIPTLNEAGNVEVLLERLDLVLAGVHWEAVFVDDDSTDGTPELLRAIASRGGNVRVLQRIGRRGLASACIEGMMATAAPYLAVMDADLQHDESILPEMLRRLKEGGLDIVVASRHMEGGGVGGFGKRRLALSYLGSLLSRLVCRQRLSDPMSGYFVLDRRFLESVVRFLSGTGFKILLDLVATSKRKVAIAEVPYTFRARHSGVTKLDTRTLVEYLYLLVDKTLGTVLPSRFVLFGMVGVLGLVPFLGLLKALLAAGWPFLYAQALATLAAMTINYFLNNIWTFREDRLSGSRLWTGLLSFYIACSLGAFLNLRFAEYLLLHGLPWYMAGSLGMLMGWVWNYGVTSVVTWRRGVRRRKALHPGRDETAAPNSRGAADAARRA